MIAPFIDSQTISMAFKPAMALADRARLFARRRKLDGCIERFLQSELLTNNAKAFEDALSDREARKTLIELCLNTRYSNNDVAARFIETNMAQFKSNETIHAHLKELVNLLRQTINEPMSKRDKVLRDSINSETTETIDDAIRRNANALHKPIEAKSILDLMAKSAIPMDSAIEIAQTLGTLTAEGMLLSAAVDIAQGKQPTLDSTTIMSASDTFARYLVRLAISTGDYALARRIADTSNLPDKTELSKLAEAIQSATKVESGPDFNVLSICDQDSAALAMAELCLKAQLYPVAVESFDAIETPLNHVALIHCITAHRLTALREALPEDQLDIALDCLNTFPTWASREDKKECLLPALCVLESASPDDVERLRTQADEEILGYLHIGFMLARLHTCSIEESRRTWTYGAQQNEPGLLLAASERLQSLGIEGMNELNRLFDENPSVATMHPYVLEYRLALQSSPVSQEASAQMLHDLGGTSLIYLILGVHLSTADVTHAQEYINTAIDLTTQGDVSALLARPIQLTNLAAEANRMADLENIILKLKYYPPEKAVDLLNALISHEAAPKTVQAFASLCNPAMINDERWLYLNALRWYNADRYDQSIELALQSFMLQRSDAAAELYLLSSAELNTSPHSDVVDFARNANDSYLILCAFWATIALDTHKAESLLTRAVLCSEKHPESIGRGKALQAYIGRHAGGRHETESVYDRVSSGCMATLLLPDGSSVAYAFHEDTSAIPEDGWSFAGCHHHSTLSTEYQLFRGMQIGDRRTLNNIEYELASIEDIRHPLLRYCFTHIAETGLATELHLDPNSPEKLVESLASQLPAGDFMPNVLRQGIPINSEIRLPVGFLTGALLFNRNPVELFLQMTNNESILIDRPRKSDISSDHNKGFILSASAIMMLSMLDLSCEEIALIQRCNAVITDKTRARINSWISVFISSTEKTAGNLFRLKNDTVLYSEYTIEDQTAAKNRAAKMLSFITQIPTCNGITSFDNEPAGFDALEMTARIDLSTAMQCSMCYVTEDITESIILSEHGTISWCRIDSLLAYAGISKQRIAEINESLSTFECIG